MEYKSWTIAECVKEVNNSIFLPDIQRPYVWEEEDIYLLFDSLCRNYPINTVLFWYLKKETLQSYDFIKRVKFIEELDAENKLDTGALMRDMYYLVIDGQQRITSLYLTLKGNYKIKNKRKMESADLYFNFLSGEQENEEEMLFEFQFFPIDKDDVWIEKNVDPKKKSTSSEKYWIRVKYVMGLQQLYTVQTSVRNKIKEKINYEIPDEQLGHIFLLWSKLNHESLITFYEEKTQKYDEVLDIFIRTNQGGQKLKYSDLLFSYVKLNWKDAREKFSELLTALNDSQRFKFDNDFILKTILFIHAKDQEGMKYRTANFTKKILDGTKDSEEWDDHIVKATKLTRDLISDKFLLTSDKLVTSYNALIPIFYFLYKNNIKGIGEEKDKLTFETQTVIREWLITTVLTGVFSGQSDGILYRAKMAIDENVNGNNFPKIALFEKFNEAKPALNISLTEDIISKSSYNSKDSYLLLSLLYNCSINFSPLVDDNKPQQDHILSQHELKQAGVEQAKINSIYNIRYVTASDNRQKSNEPFIAWSRRLGDSVLDKHFIPHGEWDASNFDEFLIERKKLFLKQLGIPEVTVQNSDSVSPMTNDENL